MKRQLLDQLNAARAEGRPIILAVALYNGDARLVEPGAKENYAFCGVDMKVAALAALSENRSRVIETPDGEIFLNVFNPPLRLVIVGAVHIAQALIPMARALDYQVSIVDPRGAFADDQRFAGLDVSQDWPDEALETMGLDGRSAVVTLTHDPKLDDAALGVALKSTAFYIGCLGSRKTHAARLERLRQNGFDKDNLARIHGPVGLDIGARSAAEIAISVLAEMTRVLNGRAP